MNELGYIYKKGTRAILLLIILGAMQGCKSYDDDEYVMDDHDTTVHLALSASSKLAPVTTRMPIDVAQAQTDPVFRGINNLTLIPFNVERKIKSGDEPLQIITKDSQDASLALDPEKQYDFFNISPLQLTTGTASYLVYGRAIPKSGADRFHNGALTESYTTTYAPDDITFTPVAIYSDNSSKQANILAYLNSIAKATINTTDENKDKEWYASTGDTWPTLFQGFAGYVSGTPMRLAGSSTNLLKHIQLWEESLSLIGGHYADNILAAIRNTTYVTVSEGKVSGFNTTDENGKIILDAYPTNLPDGAAGFKWNNSTNEFEVDNDNDFSQYAYPAELWYYGNSRIYTSNSKKSNSGNDWPTILNNFENKGEGNEGVTIDAKTRSIAIKDPLQYGVARLDVQIQAGSSTIEAKKPDATASYMTIDLSDNTSNKYFPLTAILVGGQHQQGFDFTPKNSDPNAIDAEYFIYDNSIENNLIYLSDYIRTTNGNANYTDDFSAALPILTVQTKINKSVKVVLEFENNWGDFQSENGIIYKDTKFYLMASVAIPNESVAPECRDQVLTKDYITTAQFTISSLNKAYNTLPSMTSDKVRLFETVEAAVKIWTPGQTIDHRVYNW